MRFIHKIGHLSTQGPKCPILLSNQAQLFQQMREAAGSLSNKHNKPDTLDRTTLLHDVVFTAARSARSSHTKMAPEIPFSPMST